MIFINFMLVVMILLLSAHFSGDIKAFINVDSLIIVIIGFVFSSIAISIGRFKLFINGLKEIFAFSRKEESNREIKNMFISIAIMTMCVGISSTAQGIICGVLIKSVYSISETIVIASFTTIYSFILSSFILLPVSYRNMKR